MIKGSANEVTEGSLLRKATCYLKRNKWNIYPYFAMYDAFFAQIFLGKIRMHIIHGHGIMITYRGYNNGCKNPIYNVYKNVGSHYTQQNPHKPTPVF